MNTADAAAQALLDLLSALLQETHPKARKGAAVTLDSHLERDLGLDSLGRTELSLRCERTFGVRLPEEALVVDTPRDLLRLVLATRGSIQAALAATARYQLPVTTAETTPEHAATLLEVLDWQVQIHPDRCYLYLYGKDDQVEQELSYAALQQGARTVATGLRERGLQSHQTVAIMLPTGVAYFYSFFGILLAGGIPVPIYPPVRPSQLEEHLRRHSRILNNAQTAILITVPEAKTVARLLQAQVEGLRHVVTVEELTQTGDDWRPSPIHPRDLAFLQYTSGSTGDPKGVMLTHANLLANIRAMGTRVQAGSTDVFVSWLPLYHDMGLIGACLGSLYYSMPLVLLSPLSFMARPSRWLWAIHRHRGTLSAAPNFAYELCLRSASDSSLEGLDLSSWRIAFNGAEPVNPATLERFIRRFSPYGLRAEAIAPVYGLAESAVGVTLHPPGRGLLIDRVRRSVFMQTGRALPAVADDTDVVRFVSCGQPLAGHQVRVVDEHGRELPERQEGRLEFQGPSCTSGYFRNPEATRRLFNGDWLDSGDRAYLVGSDVYITGRVKDLIIRGGRNFYPYELEDAVGRIAGIRHGSVAVFASPDPSSGTERLVLVAETRHAEAQDELRRQIQAVTVELLGTPADEVVLVPPYTVLKTSSGKLRRVALRELYEHQALGHGPRKLWWQLTRLTLLGGLSQLRRWLRHGMDTLYAAYAWTVFLVLAPLVWIALPLLPRLSWRWIVARRAGRLLAWLTGTGIEVQGLENLPRRGPVVMVANHASYLDSLVLATAIPWHFSYVAKRELLDSFALRLPLKRLDTLFVERFDVQRSATEASQVVEFVRSGRSLVVFPEGTFDRMPGLLPFRMGAFVAAAQAGVPVVPVTIRGTRSMLRSGSWFPRRGKLQISVGAPILPTGSDWQAAVKLRDAARAVILRNSGEPDSVGEEMAYSS
jgi:1-acyl-sn-glycerol-3-phosphate acyltransferase